MKWGWEKGGDLEKLVRKMSLSQQLDEEEARQTMGEKKIQTKGLQWEEVKGGEHC